MAKKSKLCIVTEKDIVFTIIFERYCGYCGKNNSKHTKTVMKRYARSNFEGIKCVKGHTPKMTEWEPVTQSETGESHIKYIAQCDYAGVKKFLFNSGLYYESNSMGILDDDGHKAADAYTSDIQEHYEVAQIDKTYFKRFGDIADEIYAHQGLSRENAYIGLEIPYSRLEEALVLAFKQPLEEIKDEKKLKVIQQNIDKLESAYRLVLDWVKNDIESDKPMPTFSVDFREQDLFV